MFYSTTKLESHWSTAVYEPREVLRVGHPEVNAPNTPYFQEAGKNGDDFLLVLLVFLPLVAWSLLSLVGE